MSSKVSGYVPHPLENYQVTRDLVGDASGEVIGTISTRPGGPNSPPHPAWAAERYQLPERAAQLFRAYVNAQHRRRCVGFWIAMPTTLIYDGRGKDGSQAVHFELAFADGTFRRDVTRVK